MRCRFWAESDESRAVDDDEELVARLARAREDGALRHLHDRRDVGDRAELAQAAILEEGHALEVPDLLVAGGAERPEHLPDELHHAPFVCLSVSFTARPASAPTFSEPPQALELPALALGRSAGTGLTPRRRRLADPRWRRGRQILVQRASHRRGPADGRERLDLHEPLAAALRDAEAVAHSHRLGRLRGVVVDVHFAPRARGGGQASRLEEARGPEPLVHAERIRRICHAQTVS